MNRNIGTTRSNRMADFLAIALAIIGIARSLHAADEPAQTFRPPAVPLVTSDPYLSVWSEADHLYDNTTRHWTGRNHPLVSLVRIDGKSYRIMGDEPAGAPPLPQMSLKVWPTRTIYEFEGAGVHVRLSFMTPVLPSDLDVMSRPVTYLTWDIHSIDGTQHAVQIYDSTSSLLTVNKVMQEVSGSRETAGALTNLKIGTTSQQTVSNPGDGTRIDWGYVCTAAMTKECTAAIGSDKAMLESFAQTGKLPGEDDAHLPRPAFVDTPVEAIAFDLGQVGTDVVSRHAMIAYDEVYSIKYFGIRLKPYWARNGENTADLLKAAEQDYKPLTEKCEQFDQELLADAKKMGGDDYANIIALAYRQCWAGNGICADANGQPLLFPKENTSNGDISTVDVIFPMDPIWVFLNPTLAKATLVPDLVYANSAHWKFPNAPHDLGTYPILEGRDDGGEGMPVEESGNMIILCDAIAQADGNADFVTPWWPKITQWAKYLEQYGLDPEQQLCTDDFMGHLAHNSNLSVKAILALAAYGDLCKMRGDAENAARYAELAKTDALHWTQAAADGDHYNLAFNKPNTWSQKYNLVWDQILGLNVFPPEVRQKEFAYYKTVMQPYGLPLDSRTKLTKSDWTLWSATLAPNQEEFEGMISPMVKYLNTTTSRMPFVDSYVTNDPASSGFHARPVIGGVFIRMLTDRDLWKKWASRDTAKAANWADMPSAPFTTELNRRRPRMQTTEVVPTSRKEAQQWKYTQQRPADGWQNARFDDSAWTTGPGGFGSKGTPRSVIGTTWDTDDIWLRREITVPDGDLSHLQFSINHHDDAEVYLNGVLSALEDGSTTGYANVEIAKQGLGQLKSGQKVTLAVHCHHGGGSHAIDVGLVSVTIAPPR
jgi:hypothetical protein